MSSCQFVRSHVYSPNKIGDVLSEADRHPGFVSHVENPQPPNWVLGSRQEVQDAITLYMSKPAPVRARDGSIAFRKRRKDHRCLVAGVVTWPDTVAQCKAQDYPRERKEAFKRWYLKTREWLNKQFADKLISVCFHMDESHPHLHFFVVGDAQRLHPGMKNELINDRRMVINDDRFSAHKSGLKSWLDDFHQDVGDHCGLARSNGSRPAWRIQDRGTRSRLCAIDKALAARPDVEIQRQRDELWDAERKTARPSMFF